jgi:hypothetical protein
VVESSLVHLVFWRAFNNETRDGSTTSSPTTAIRQCEQRCNDDFMSLKPVDVR